MQKAGFLMTRLNSKAQDRKARLGLLITVSRISSRVRGNQSPAFSFSIVFRISFLLFSEVGRLKSTGKTRREGSRYMGVQGESIIKRKLDFVCI